MATASQIQYGTWADRNTPQQILWEKKISSREPEVLDMVLRIFNSTQPIHRNINNTRSSDAAARNLLRGGEYIPQRNSQVSLDVYRAIRHKYNGLFVATTTSVNSNNVNFSLTGSVATAGVAQSPASRFALNFQPISTFIGTTLYLTPGVHESPVHVSVPITVVGSLERISARFKQEIISVQASLKLDELLHVPSQIMGSLRHMASALSSLLAGPVNLIKDLYKGAMRIILMISKVIGNVFKLIQRFIVMAIGAVTSFIFNAVKGILEGVISVVGGLIKGVLTAIKNFTGVSITAKINASVVMNISQNALMSKANGLINLKNPTSVNTMFQRPNIGAARGVSLNSVSGIRNNFLPSSITSKLGTVFARRSSFGMVGSNAFGLSLQLNTTKAGVLSNILRVYGQQTGILQHVFNGGHQLPRNHIVGNARITGFDNTAYNINVSRNVVRPTAPNFISVIKG